jgi:cation:H+ antiporter
MDIVLAIIGLAMLLAAGDLLVRGAVALSLRLGVPKMIVALSIVAFGTSAPELLISVQAALLGVPDIAVGNVVGSNIANVLLVLGVPAIIATIPAAGAGSRRSLYQMLAATVLMIGLCFLGPLHYWHAAVLLATFAAMLFDLARESGKHPGFSEQEIAGADGGLPTARMAAYLALGLVGLPLGAHLLIEGAIGIARQLGVSEAVIGLSLVAVGTSLPELATTVMAALRRHVDVIMGNVIGSCLFNILSILGIASLFGPIPIGREFLARDLWVMLGCALVLALFVLGDRRIGRRVGVALVLAYGVYAWMLFRAGGGMA